MKRTTKILSGSLLVALMSIGLATKIDASKTNLEVRDVLTQDMTRPVTGRVVRRANEVAENKVSAVKAQVSENLDGFRHIRFVAGIDSVAYANAKFDIVAKDDDAVVKTFADKAVTTAYTHIEAAGEVLSAADVFGADYNYLVAFTINNVPESAWGYTFEISASVKTEEAVEYTTSEVAQKVINNIVDADELVEPSLPTSLAFGAASAEEREYLYAESFSGTVENNRRWADNNAYYIYKFNLGKAITSLKLDLVIENDTKIEVSYDGETYVEFANSLTENANGCGRYFGNVTNSFNVPVTENTGVVYLRFSDAKTDDGFGCCLYTLNMSWAF